MVSAPKAPDPAATAQAQGAMNKETAIATQELNATNQITPQGSLEYVLNGYWPDGTPHLTATQTLIPELQSAAFYNHNMQQVMAQTGYDQAGKMRDLLNTPYAPTQGDINGITSNLPTPGTTYSPLRMQHSEYAPQINAATNAAQAAAGASVGAPNATTTTANPAPAAQITAAPGQVGTRETQAPGDQQATNAISANAPTQVQTTGIVAGQPGQRYTYSNGTGVEVAGRYTGNTAPVQTYGIDGNDKLASDLYGAAQSRFEPQIARQRQQLDTDLANKGLTPGSTGYSNAMQDFQRGVNDLYTNTFLQGQNQAFNQSAQRAQNDFSQGLQSQGQWFNQNLNANQQNFGQDVTRTQNAFQNALAANQANFGQDLTLQQNLFNQTLGANNQNFNQALASSNQDFGQRAQAAQQNFDQARNARQDYFGNQLAANNQNFNQSLGATNSAFNNLLTSNNQNFNQAAAANNQDFTQRLQANNQNYNQALQGAQFGAQQNNDQFNRYLGLSQSLMGQQGQDFNQQQGAAQFLTSQQQYNANLALQQRQQALQELLQQRQEPINELNSFLNGSALQKQPLVSTPSATVQPADLTSIVNNNYNQATRQYQSTLGGLAGLGGTLMSGMFGLSDERAKEDIHKVGKDPESGHNVYAFRYKPEYGGGMMQLGLMAQDVQKKQPDAILKLGQGKDALMAVDYGKALSRGKEC